MAKNFLITRPTYDKITSYLHDFSKETIKTIKTTKDIHIIDLDGPKANRINLENSFHKENPKLIFLNGHGDKKTVAGDNDKIILDEENIELTKDKIVYALACNSLEELGKIAIKKGTKAYVGYEASFMIVCDPSRESAPYKDKNALPFKRACVKLINALVFGKSVGEAIELTKEEYKHSIRSYGTGEDDPYGDVPLIRFALSWDLEFLNMLGDPNAKF